LPNEEEAMHIEEQNDFSWTDRIQAKWDDVKGDILKAFGRLTEDDLTEAAGEREKLVSKLMTRYQLTREQAEQRLFTWERSIP
jgi:uncharacterized protein YjbJ (UPF0337 family)